MVRRPILAGCFMWACCLLATHAENSVAPPVGFVLIGVPEHGQTLASMPFEPFGTNLDTVLGNQLTPGGVVDTSDQILKWDSLALEYVSAYRADGASSETESFWTTEMQTGTPSDMQLMPGDGFWIVSHQPFYQSLMLAGGVVVDETFVIPLCPSLNLLGYPFSTAITIAESGLTSLWTQDLATAGDTLRSVETPDTEDEVLTSFRIGEGYWYNSGQDPKTWMEARPYDNPFSTNGVLPVVTDLDRLEDGAAIRLMISCDTRAGETLDVLYQDFCPDTVFNPFTGWLPAQLDVVCEGSSRMDWTDRGSPTRLPPNAVPGRLYLVMRSDLRSFFSGPAVEDAGKALPDETLLIDPDPLIPIPAVPGQLAATPSETNACAGPVDEEATAMAVGHIVYVDRRLGHDTFSGRWPRALDIARGPKRSLGAALIAALPGDELVIRAGRYGEDFDIAGRSLTVRLEGNVDISGDPPQEADVPLESLLPPGFADVALTQE